MRPVLLVLLAAMLFGTTGTAQALGAPDVAALSLGSARIVIGGSALAVVAVLLARRMSVRRAATRAPRRGTRFVTAPALLSVLVGAAAVVAYQPAFFLGTERNGVAVGTLVALGSAPLATGLLSWLLVRRFPGARWCVATGIAVLGLMLLAGVGGVGGTGAGGGADGVTGASGTDLPGLACSLGAGVSYAVYAVMSKRLLDSGWGSAEAMGAIFGVAAVASVALLLTTDIGWLGGTPGMLTVLWLGLITVCVAYLFFAAGLRRLSAASVSTLTLAEPLTAALLGLGLLGETLAPASWVGLAAIVAGIVVLLTGSGAIGWRFAADRRKIEGCTERCGFQLHSVTATHHVPHSGARCAWG